jgi:hypothetical protein
MPRGGARQGAGRKSKAEELNLQTKLDPMEVDFLSSLHKAIKDGNPVAMKLYAEYRFGKPTDHVDLTSGGERMESVKEIVFRDYANKPGV